MKSYAFSFKTITKIVVIRSSSTEGKLISLEMGRFKVLIMELLLYYLGMGFFKVIKIFQVFCPKE